MVILSSQDQQTFSKLIKSFYGRVRTTQQTLLFESRRIEDIEEYGGKKNKKLCNSEKKKEKKNHMKIFVADTEDTQILSSEI